MPEPATAAGKRLLRDYFEAGEHAEARTLVEAIEKEARAQVESRLHELGEEDPVAAFLASPEAERELTAIFCNAKGVHGDDCDGRRRAVWILAAWREGRKP